MKTEDNILKLMAENKVTELEKIVKNIQTRQNKNKKFIKIGFHINAENKFMQFQSFTDSGFTREEALALLLDE